jgi:hypothetical protein
MIGRETVVKSLPLVPVAAIALLAASCGGGAGEPTPTPTPSPIDGLRSMGYRFATLAEFAG